ncbi:TerB N-terminal domain-containing protein [Crystallibacter degradans]|uniref:TerB N-terminal domain-containing protein n=1 Tax=Crystallibacter degradans TaxID=2726743 RepID=UPI001475EB3D|nr:DUF4236 domain-containing protein [Arthrobacter sp. SF27]
MGFYVRKSLKAGPFRFNLTGSGVGVSAGVPGFRIGSGPRGNLVRMGAGGVYYQASLGKGQSPAYDRYDSAHLAPPASTSSDVIFEDQTGASIQTLLPTSSDDLVSQLNGASRRKPLTRWVVLAILLLGLVTMPFGFFVFLLGVPLVWWAVLSDRARNSAVVFYDVDDEYAQRFQSLVDAGQYVAQSKGLWRVNESGSLNGGHQQKVNAGAGSLVRRAGASFSDQGPKELVTNIAVPGVTSGHSSIYFLPDRILVAEKGMFTDFGYDALQVLERDIEFIESPGAVPSDGIQVGTTWQYVNKQGGPDRRFKNNPVLPVMRYMDVLLTTSSGFRWILQLSQTDSAKDFAAQLRGRSALPERGRAGGDTMPVTPPAALYPGSQSMPLDSTVSGRQEDVKGSAPAGGAPRPKAGSLDKARWYGQNESVQVDRELRVPGMVYAGRTLSSPRGGTEPSLINPSLRIDLQNPDWSGQCLGYWPSYAEITAAGRAAYLGWLAQGRRIPDIPIGYVFLFMYGLERRVLVDIAAQPELAGELVQIRAEMVDLLRLYGDSSGSFSSYASQFLDAIDFLMLQAPTAAPAQPPALTESRWLVPIGLKVQLGDLAADGTPVPAEWALAWAWFHPEITVRTPVTRCPQEFTRLFHIRYRQKYAEGFTVRPGKSRMKLNYRTASSQIGSVDLTMSHIPDVFAQQAPVKKLSALFEEVTAELDSYSRWLGRNPDRGGTLAAAALLPPDLIAEDTGAVRDFRDWVSGKLAASDTALLSGAELFDHWPSGSADKLSKPDTVNLATLLASLGAGMEPDVRFGGPTIAAEAPVFLFRSQPGSPHSPTPAYSTALTMVHLAAAVTAADGHVAPAELDHLTAHLESSLQLTVPERTRLQAHLQWLGATEVKLTGLTKRLTGLTDTQRASLADMLVTLAAADGHIAPAEVTTLQKIYKLLGLDSSTVSSKIHAVMAAGSSPATQPVTVRPAGEADAGYPIPPRPAGSVASPAKTGSGFALDPTVIQAKMAETAAVSHLLIRIFDEDLQKQEPTANIEAPEESEPGVAQEQFSPADAVGGLDPAHSMVVHALVGMEQLGWNEFQDLAALHGLLPEGALDTLNEAAFEASDEPLIEGEETLTVNAYALQELLS